MEAVNTRIDQLEATQTAHGEQLATISQQLTALNQLMQQIADQQAANSNPAAAPPETEQVAAAAPPETEQVVVSTSQPTRDADLSIKDLSLPKFDGKQAHYAYFKYQLEAYFELRHDIRDDATKIKVVVAGCFEKSALSYIASLITRNALPSTWSAFTKLLDTRFSHRDDQDVIYQRLTTLRQHDSSVDKYTDQFYTYYSQLQLEEATAMLQYKLGLNPTLAKSLRSWQQQPTTLEQLVAAVKSLEDYPHDNDGKRSKGKNNYQDHRIKGDQRNNHNNNNKGGDYAKNNISSKTEHQLNKKDDYKGKQFNTMTTETLPSASSSSKN